MSEEKKKAAKKTSKKTTKAKAPKKTRGAKRDGFALTYPIIVHAPETTKAKLRRMSEARTKSSRANGGGFVSMAAIVADLIDKAIE